MRSPIWLRLISDVPPAIDMAAVHQHEHRRSIIAVAVHERRLGPGELGDDRRALVAELGQHQLGDGALGPGPAAGDGPVGRCAG